MESQYWMVLGNGAPRYRHQTLGSARTEAERLAKANPGTRFTILLAVASCEVQSVTWQDLKQPIDEKPTFTKAERIEKNDPFNEAALCEQRGIKFSLFRECHGGNGNIPFVVCAQCEAPNGRLVAVTQKIGPNETESIGTKLDKCINDLLHKIETPF